MHAAGRKVKSIEVGRAPELRVTRPTVLAKRKPSEFFKGMPTAHECQGGGGALPVLGRFCTKCHTVQSGEKWSLRFVPCDLSSRCDYAQDLH